MVNLKTELFAEPKEGIKYTISSVKEVTIKDRANKEYEALRVVMVSSDKDDKTVYSLTLWLTDEASSTSKLGSFISGFRDFFKGKEDANDTDTWLEHTIQVKRWRNKEREIEVLS